MDPFLGADTLTWRAGRRLVTKFRRLSDWRTLAGAVRLAIAALEVTMVID
jgi:hypothetical protein